MMALCALLLLTGCEDSAKKQVEIVRPVLVATVHYKPQVVDRSLVGVVRPRVEADLGFRVAGKVVTRLVEVGDVVEKGEPLALELAHFVDSVAKARQPKVGGALAKSALEVAITITEQIRAGQK